VKLLQFAPLVFGDVPENYEVKLWFACRMVERGYDEDE
jgi:hypothetical protein